MKRISEAFLVLTL